MKIETERPRIVTFYSYKGGTGRSMALANFAWIVAASGKRVLVIDWDLEAPGLHRYFRPFLVDPNLVESDGLIDVFWSFASSAMTRQQEDAPPDRDVAEALRNVRRRLEWPFSTGGYIDFIGAGRQGGTYSERVNTFDWKRFYELGGAQLLTEVKDDLRKRYDWVLIDSRTGVSDTSGICTMQMPDWVVACFTLNRQSIDGVTAVLGSIRAYHAQTVDGSKITLFPLATRIENAEQAKLEVARGYARDQLAPFLPLDPRSSARAYWDNMEIAYRPSYAFEEILAAFGDATGAAGGADTMLAQVEGMAQQITGNSALRIPEIVEADRAQVLEKYALGTASGAVGIEVPPEPDLGLMRDIFAKEAQWRHSGFRYRYLLSRRELGFITETDRKQFGRNMSFLYDNSVLVEPFTRRLNIAFIASLLVAIVAGTVVANILAVYRGFGLTALLYGFGGAYGGFVVAGFLSAVINQQFAPYRTALTEVFRFTLQGPLREEPRDYIEQNILVDAR
jgi:MinD-like ATPase involved in chromosome partitioning or flagellar assembly